MKKALIFGGAGFIGSHLVKKLNKNGYFVEIVDKKSPAELIGKNFKFYRGNIKNLNVFKKLNSQYDMVYHLAAQTSARISEEKPLEDIETNYLGTFNICEWAKNNKPKQIIFTSSMAVYSSSNKKLNEKSKLDPKSNYGKTKLESEYLITSLNKFQIKTTILRLFNVYGPGQNYKNLKQGMVSIYVYYAIFKKKILVTGSLERFRDFIYISDVINILLKAQKFKNNLILNVANGNKITVNKLLKKICKKCKIDFNKSVKITKSHSGDTFGTFSDIKNLQKIYKPKVNLENGLTKIIADAKKHKNNRALNR